MNLIQNIDIVEKFDKNHLIKEILILGKEDNLIWIFKSFTDKVEIVDRLKKIDISKTFSICVLIISDLELSRINFALSPAKNKSRKWLYRNSKKNSQNL